MPHLLSPLFHCTVQQPLEFPLKDVRLLDFMTVLLYISLLLFTMIPTHQEKADIMSILYEYDASTFQQVCFCPNSSIFAIFRKYAPHSASLSQNTSSSPSRESPLSDGPSLFPPNCPQY